jgi:hypothetical protein
MSAKFYTYTHRRNDTGEIFYVGKGKEKRAWETERNPHWKHIAKKHGHTVTIEIDNLDAEQALELEKQLIALYGRLDCGLGKLVNMTDGGDGGNGGKGKPITPEHKAKIGAANKIAHARLETREKMQAIVNSPEIIAKTSAPHKGKLVSAETRAKHSASTTAQMSDPKARANISDKLTGIKRSDEFCEQHRIRQKTVMSSPEVRSKLKAAWVRRKAASLAEVSA